MQFRPNNLWIQECDNWLKAFAHSFVVLTLAAIIVLGGIVSLSSGFAWSPPWWAEFIAHGTGFGLFTLAFGLYFRNMTAILLLALLGSVGIEFAQLFIPNRSFSLLDIIANDFGAIVVWLVHLYSSGVLKSFRTGDEAIASGA